MLSSQAEAQLLNSHAQAQAQAQLLNSQVQAQAQAQAQAEAKAKASENQILCTKRPQIHRVSPELRLKSKQNDQVYDPVIVSIGPYHHSKPEFQRAQEFKHYCLFWCTKGLDDQKDLFYNEILKIINEVRGCYADVPCVNEYDDEALASMMLLDACFIINFMVIRKERGEEFHRWCNHLGVAAVITFTAGDIMLLENQIPFIVLQLIVRLREKEEHREIEDFLGWMVQGNLFLSWIPVEQPLHILEAFYRVLAEQKMFTLLDKDKPMTGAEMRYLFQGDEQESTFHGDEQESTFHGDEQESTFLERLKFRFPATLMGNSQMPDSKFIGKYYDRKEMVSQTGNSVMDLKAKGINVMASSSTSLRDIEFWSYPFHGKLQLPISSVSGVTRVLLSNMLAFEISPGSDTDLVILSYISFMKSLIESPDDVKELEKKGILINQLANREEVVKLFQEIDTFGFFNLNHFSDVNQRIMEHCNSKATTWMAELINTWFRSPWTFITLLAASLLLCLTFMQTYFTIHPAKGN